DGRVTVERGANSKPHTYNQVNLEARDLSSNTSFPFTLSASMPGGGSLKLEGKAGPVDIEDASLTPFMATLNLTHLDVLATGFIPPEAGLAGIFDFVGSVTSDGRHLQSKGHVKASKLQLAKGGTPAGEPVAINYTLTHDLKNQSGNLSEADVQAGQAVAHLNGTYVLRGESTLLKMKLRAESMPAQDVEALLPAVGVVLPKGASLQGGTLSADLATEGPVEKLVTTGSVGVFDTRLAGFDLGSKIRDIASLAGVKPDSVTNIERLTSDLRVSPEGMQASNLVLVVPSLGQLTGAGTVGASNSLDFKMLADLAASGGLVGDLNRLTGAKGGKGLNIPFFIRGTTSNPTFVPDTRGIAGELLGPGLLGKGTSGT
ncbi:MAG TPA: hypothetical protein VN203_20750, partial [Candidatus Acidoferrum sp.]|nr:hypothetical protein [Candidatus Acidoferrum sp.]